MTLLDWIIVVVVALSSLYSLMRGFVREVMSIISWIAAFSVAGLCYGKIAPLLTFANDETTRNVLASVILFIATLLVVGLVAGWLGRMIQQRSAVSVADRVLGMILGFARGILVVCAIMAVMHVLFKLNIATFVQGYDWWKDSLFLPEIQKIVHWFFDYLASNTNLLPASGQV